MPGFRTGSNLSDGEDRGGRDKLELHVKLGAFPAPRSGPEAFKLLSKDFQI